MRGTCATEYAISLSIYVEKHDSSIILLVYATEDDLQSHLRVSSANEIFRVINNLKNMGRAKQPADRDYKGIRFSRSLVLGSRMAASFRKYSYGQPSRTLS